MLYNVMLPAPDKTGTDTGQPPPSWPVTDYPQYRRQVPQLVPGLYAPRRRRACS